MSVRWIIREENCVKPDVIHTYKYISKYYGTSCKRSIIVVTCYAWVSELLILILINFNFESFLKLRAATHVFHTLHILPWTTRVAVYTRAYGRVCVSISEQNSSSGIIIIKILYTYAHIININTLYTKTNVYYVLYNILRRLDCMSCRVAAGH